ncbi:MAG: translation initiation factor IF-6 [Candidatus Methanomethyliaceae archaeon]|nr:translation initiation factor IF-6 [Candidatus Methanomethyliaceae archaeon]MDW7970678.1 translation initiation factor IF-6 [Nitrososphaerota archaeon]
MPISRASIYGNSNIGVFVFANDSFALVPYDAPEKFVAEISNTLKVPVHRATICGSVLLGIFIIGNSRGILVPHNAREDEISFIEKATDFPIIQYRGKYNALGNMILLNDKSALVSPRADKELRLLISNELGVEVFEGQIAGVSLPGACAVMNSRAILCHPKTSNEEMAKLEKIFNKPVHPSTVNCGIPYLRVGMIVNSNGAVVGEDTTGPEMAHIESSLGLVE